MKIIIVGCGKVGYTIAKNLSVEKDIHVTVIDSRTDVLENALESIDVMFVRGNGLSVSTLLEAGARDADLIISVTSADEVNILCCMSAKRLGTKQTAARVRDPEYALELNNLWKDLGIDLIVNPEQQTAHEISRLLRFPTADDIDTFINGRVELVSFKVSESADFFVGKSVAQIFFKNKRNILLAAVERDNEVLIPTGELVFEKRDIVRVLGQPSDIMGFFTLIGKNTEKVKNVVIIGGSKISYYLVGLLHKHSSYTSIKIIETDHQKCEALSEAFPRCLIINGDGSDEDILSSEVVDPAGAVVCLTNRDEENTVIALYAIHMGVRKVIVKINHINTNLVKNLGLGSIVSTKNITSNQIIQYVRRLSGAIGREITTIYTIFQNNHDRVEAVEFDVNKKSKCLDIPIKDLKLKKGILIGCIVRNSAIIIPTGESTMKMGDKVIIIKKNCNTPSLDSILK